MLFVPTFEIAKTFHRYKNSILKFNPRSYLELAGAKVNQAIRNTILQEGKNEFALYNNGITMLSEDTSLNERIGQRNKARLNVRNPQIINGGQTAYTLSRIYEEHTPEEAEALFDGKEVLLKVITLNSEDDAGQEEKLKLIDAVSIATNQQTEVITADRYSNEPVNVQLQKTLFDRYGLLFERKRGEFEDGIRNEYIERGQIVERNLFFRILFAANGDLNRAVQKRLFAKLSKSGWAVPAPDQLDRFYFAWLCLRLLDVGENEFHTKEIYGKLYVMTSLYIPSDVREFESVARAAVRPFAEEWEQFVKAQAQNNIHYRKVKVNRVTQQQEAYFNKNKWVRSGSFPKDVKNHFKDALMRREQE